MAAAERLPLLKEAERLPAHAPPRATPFFQIFLCCVALAVVAASTARLLPRGVAGRPSQATELREEYQAKGVMFKDEEDGATLAPGAHHMISRDGKNRWCVYVDLSTHLFSFTYRDENG